MSIVKDDVIALIKKLATVYDENKDYLSELDAAIGDGDHGHNLSKGFHAVVAKLDTTTTNDIGDVLKLTAMTLISNVGGASGPLYGTLFLKASALGKDKQELTLTDFCMMLRVGIEGVQQRGKAQRGEKTMLDVLIPVLECLEDCVQKNLDPIESLHLATTAAKEGIAFTKTIKATKGRASYVGDRSIGHIDPGAMSSYLLIATIDAFRNEASL